MKGGYMINEPKWTGTISKKSNFLEDMYYVTSNKDTILEAILDIMAKYRMKDLEKINIALNKKRDINERNEKTPSL